MISGIGKFVYSDNSSVFVFVFVLLYVFIDQREQGIDSAVASIVQWRAEDKLLSYLPEFEIIQKNFRK